MVQLEHATLDANTLCAALKSICSEEDFARFERDRNLDFAFELDRDDDELGKLAQRFRVNFFYSGESPGALHAGHSRHHSRLQLVELPHLACRKDQHVP